MVGNLVSGKRIAQASGRDLGQIEDNDQARKVSVLGVQTVGRVAVAQRRGGGPVTDRPGAGVWEALPGPAPEHLLPVSHQP